MDLHLRKENKWLRVLVISFLLFLSACGPSNGQDPVEKIRSNQLKELLEQHADLRIIDVRTPEEVSYGVIPGAIHIDYYQPDFLKKIDQMDKSEPVVVYCAVGGRSAGAASKMKNLGFEKIYDLTDGARGWVSSGYALSKNSD